MIARAREVCQEAETYHTVGIIILRSFSTSPSQNFSVLFAFSPCQRNSVHALLTWNQGRSRRSIFPSIRSLVVDSKGEGSSHLFPSSARKKILRKLASHRITPHIVKKITRSGQKFQNRSPRIDLSNHILRLLPFAGRFDMGTGKLCISFELMTAEKERRRERAV